MIRCQSVENVSSVVGYLRRDVVANLGLLMSLERNVPAVPKMLWAAYDAGDSLCGLALREEFPHGACTDLRADRPEALAALLDCPAIAAARVVVPDHLRAMLLEQLPQAKLGGEVIVMTAAAGDVRPVESPYAVRRLGVADLAAAQRFPSQGRREPPLARYVEWAQSKPDLYAVFGLTLGEEIACYAQFSLQLDGVWEVIMIRTRAEHQGKGLAKAVLSAASREMLAGPRARTLVYSVDFENVPSRRTAEAVGYRECCRRLSYQLPQRA